MNNDNLKQDQLIKFAHDCYKNKDHKQALDILSNLLNDKNINTEQLVKIHSLLGSLFNLRGEIGKAIKSYHRVLTLDADNIDAAIALSVLYNDIGNYEESKKIFFRAQELTGKQSSSTQVKHINKKFASKHYELGELYLSYSRYEEALFEFNKTLSLDSSRLEARIKIANLYAKKNLYTKAYQVLQELKNEEPDFIPARIALGVLCYGRKKIIEAQREWEAVLLKDPQNKQAAMYLNLSKSATETHL